MKIGNNVIKLSVLEERVSNMIRENSEEHAEILKNIKCLSEKFDKLPETFVSRSEFEPISKIVYGLVLLVVTTVVGAILKVVLKL